MKRQEKIDAIAGIIFDGAFLVSRLTSDECLNMAEDILDLFNVTQKPDTIIFENRFGDGTKTFPGRKRKRVK